VAGQQVSPRAIAELGRVLGRADNVGEQHCGEPPVDRCGGARTGDELLDLGDKRALIARPDQVVSAGQLDVPRPIDVGSEVPAMVGMEAGRIRVLDHQRRDADGREDGAGVDGGEAAHLGQAAHAHLGQAVPAAGLGVDALDGRRA